MFLDRLLGGRPSADAQLTALARVRAFAGLDPLPPLPGASGGAPFGSSASDARAPVEPASGELAGEGPARLRLDPGRHGLVAMLCVGALAAVLAGGLYLRSRPQLVAAPARVAAGTSLLTPAPSPRADVVVDVAGRVVHPGVVTLPAGARVADALRAAGGPLPGTDSGLLNLARKLVDGEQVLVGVTPAPGAAGPAAGPPGSVGGLVDLNSATQDQLESLPGVGPVLAQRILDWRNTHGGFRSVDQLREVSGIGEAKFADIKAKVTV